MTRLPWLVCPLLAACVSANPSYSDVAAGDSTGGPAVATTSGARGTSSTSGPTTGGVAQTSTDGAPPQTSTVSSTTDGLDDGGTTGTSTGPGPLESGSSTGDRVAFGSPCGEVEACEGLAPEAVCCDEPQCAGTCMVPCRDDVDCIDLPNTECAHNYCLFRCEDDDDADCLWLGGEYTCQHSGTLCESDDMD